MARKPFRHKILTQEILERISQLEKPPPPLGVDEFLAFNEGVVNGLFDRLERKAPKEAQAAAHALLYALDHFGALTRFKGLEVARLTTQYFVAGLTARGKRVDPISLLVEYGSAVEEVSKCRSYERRKEWLRKQGMNENNAGKFAASSPANMAEHGLAKRRGVSHSEVRKTLRRAPQRLKTLLAQKHTRKPR